MAAADFRSERRDSEKSLIEETPGEGCGRNSLVHPPRASFASKKSRSGDDSVHDRLRPLARAAADEGDDRGAARRRRSPAGGHAALAVLVECRAGLELRPAR